MMPEGILRRRVTPQGDYRLNAAVVLVIYGE